MGVWVVWCHGNDARTVDWFHVFGSKREAIEQAMVLAKNVRSRITYMEEGQHEYDDWSDYKAVIERCNSFYWGA